MAAKSTRVEAKRDPPAIPAVPASGEGRWKELPAVLVSHFLAWLTNDPQSMVAAQRTSKSWLAHAAPGQKVDQLHWRPMFLREFELDSTLDPWVAPAGEQTAWCRRYFARQRVERNWTRMRFGLTTIRFEPRQIEICGRPPSLACACGKFLSLLALPSGEETSITLGGNIDAMRADDSVQTPTAALAVAYGQNVVVVLDASSGKQRGARVEHKNVNAVDLRGDMLVTGGADGFVRVWDSNSGQPMVEIRDLASASFALSLSGSSLLTNSGTALRVWSLQTRKATRVDAELSYVVLDRQRERFLCAQNNELKVWRAGLFEPERLRSLKLGDEQNYTSVALRCDKFVLLGNSRERQLHVFDSIANDGKVSGDDLPTWTLPLPRPADLLAVNWRFLVVLHHKGAFVDVMDFACD